MKSKRNYTPIRNRYEFLMFLACVYSNPNGDPDMDNSPRMDPDTNKGYITDGAIKHRVRMYWAMNSGRFPYTRIMMEPRTNKNRMIAEAKAAGIEEAGLDVDINDTSAGTIAVSEQAACDMFLDVRTFGGVLSTGPNGGQILGPVQIAYGVSVDPIRCMDIGITCVSRAYDVKGAKTVEDYKTAEDNIPEDKKQGMGRKNLIPFGLYEIRGCISANQAEKTGFSEEDLNYLFEALVNMYDATRTSSKSMMSVVSPLIIFKHVGDPAVSEEEQLHQAMIGRAPAHKLFELVECKRHEDVEIPSSYRDYDCFVNLSKVPAGVEVGFLPSYGTAVTWNKLPDGEDWVEAR